MRILITGATGLVGNNCLRELQDAGHQLHVLVRRTSDPRPLAGLSVTSHEADLMDVETLPEVVPEVDVIIHSAGDTHIGRRERPSQVRLNVDATAKLAELACSQQARFIFVSSVDALPATSPEKPLNEEAAPGEAKYDCGYVTTKRAAERAVLAQVQQGLDATIVNPGFMLGPWDWKPSSGRMLLEVATRFTPLGPIGGFSICDVREVAKAICRLAVTKPTHARYILAGNNLPYLEAWQIFARVTGGNGPLRGARWPARALAGAFGDTLSLLTGKEGDVNSAAIAMSGLFHYYDSQRACAELDYQIPSVESAAQSAWEWFREHGYA